MTNFAIGAKVQVASLDPTCPVRAVASVGAPYIGYQLNGAQGTVTAGLTSGFVQIKFPVNPSGWVWSQNLMDAPIVVPPPPPPVPAPEPLPGITRTPVDLAKLVCLTKQYAGIYAYERYQNHVCLTATAISLEFNGLTNAGGTLKLAYSRYALLINGVQRAVYVTTTGAVKGMLTGTLGNEVDGPYFARIQPQDAAGVPIANPTETYAEFGLWIDRNGTAKNHPLVIVQNGSYTWAHGVAGAASDHVLIPKTALVPQPLPLPKRETVTPFEGVAVLDANGKWQVHVAGKPVNVARVALVPNTDAIDQDRHYPCVTNRGITVTENEQGYLPDRMFELLPRLPLLDGPRGVCTAPYSTVLEPSIRNVGKVYGASPWGVFVLDSTGTKRTMIGLRHKQGAVPYWETPPATVQIGITLGAWEIVGDWDGSINIERRIVKETWFIVWDRRSLLLDMNAAPIGGEQPHKPYQLPSGEWITGPRYFVGCDFGRVLEVRTDGSNRATPHKVREWITGLAGPWGGHDAIADNGLIVGERLAHQICEWSMDVPNTKVRTIVSSAAAGMAGQIDPRPRRRFNGNTTTARSFDICFPEGIDRIDDWLYFASMAQGEVRRINLTTGVLETNLARPIINTSSVGSYFVAIAVSDGSFGPKGTMFVNTFFNDGHGHPVAFLPNGSRWTYQTYCYGVDRGAGGNWNGGHYPTSVGLAHGRLYSGDSGGGVDYFCQADSNDLIPNYAKAQRGWEHFRKIGGPLIHGPFLVNRTTYAIPGVDNNDCLYWARDLLGQPVIIFSATPPPQPPAGEVIAVDQNTRYQTMTGWEATAIAWESNKVTNLYDPTFAVQATALANKMVNELGINRLQCGTSSGWMNPVDYWTQFVNGLIDLPTLQSHGYEKIAGAPYQFAKFDFQCDNMVLPMKAALAARGETLYVTTIMADFLGGNQGNFSFAQNPSAYVDFMLAFVTRMQTRIGVTVDAVDIILEPDNVPLWTGARIGATIVALRAALNSNGFSSVKIIGPSTTSTGNCIPYATAIEGVGGAMAALDVISYHRYQPGDLAAIKAFATARNKQTAQTEYFPATIDTMLQDLLLGQVSSWQRWSMAGRLGGSTNGYYICDPSVPAAPVFSFSTNTNHMALVFPYVRAGAQRVACTNATMTTIAFRNVNGKVMVHAKRPAGATTAPVTLTGLTQGQYGVRFIADGAGGTSNGPDITVAANGQGVFSMAPGYYTVYAR